MSVDKKIKQSIYNTARAITKEVSEKLGMEFDSNVMDVIAELTFKRLCMYGSDLDAFQRHAKRSTITADDVKLLVRRNDSLKEHLENKLQMIISMKPSPAETPTGAKRKRK